MKEGQKAIVPLIGRSCTGSESGPAVQWQRRRPAAGVDSCGNKTPPAPTPISTIPDGPPRRKTRWGTMPSPNRQMALLPIPSIANQTIQKAVGHNEHGSSGPSASHRVDNHKYSRLRQRHFHRFAQHLQVPRPRLGPQIPLLMRAHRNRAVSHVPFADHQHSRNLLHFGFANLIP